MSKNNISIFKKGMRLAGFAILGIIAAAFFAVIFAVAVKYLWNWIMPEIFGLVQITFAQAVGLIILSRLLVGGWHRGRHDMNHGNGIHGHLQRWSHSVPEKTHDDVRIHNKVFMEFWSENGKKSFDEYREKKKESSSGNSI